MAIQPPVAFGQVAVPGTHGPVGKERSWVVVFLLGMVTCGLGYLYFAWCMLSELKEFRRKDDINLILYFVPLLNILLFLELPEKVLDAKRMAGIQNPRVASGLLYVLLWWYFLPTELNEVWQAASRTAVQPTSPG